jgi:hypothetical protein
MIVLSWLLYSWRLIRPCACSCSELHVLIEELHTYEFYSMGSCKLGSDPFSSPPEPP